MKVKALNLEYSYPLMFMVFNYCGIRKGPSEFLNPDWDLREKV